jgi:hypothetical protein
MATLTGRAPKDTYGDLLQVSNANDGVDSTLRFLSDGKGTNSSFKISSSDAQFTSTLTSTGLLTTTAGIVSGSNIISDTDSTDDLGSTGVRWANLWVDNITMGGTIAGAVATFSSTLTVTGLTTIASLKGTGAVTITDILDEDNMASDSATVLATQQSIKAYVDAQVGTVDTLSEVLAIGNTSGATDLVMDSGQKVTTNTIDETTAASGVTIDSVLVKDSTVTAGTLTIGAGSVTDSSGAISFGNENLVTTGTLGCGALTSTGIDDNATSTQLTISDSASTFAGDVTIDGETLLVNSPSTATDVAAIHFNGSTTASSRYANISKMYDSPYTMKMQASNSAGESPLELWGSSDTMYLGFDISGNATFAGDITGLTLNATGGTSAGDNAAMGYSSTYGAMITGQGSTYDTAIFNDANTAVMGVLTGTQDVRFWGRTLSADGSAASPSMIFRDDGDTGVYRPTTNQWAVATGGTNALTLDASQNATFAGNINVGGDADTGLTLVGANNLGIQTGGTTRFNIDSIGKATFTNRMVGNDGTAALPAFGFTGDLNTGMYRIGSDHLGFSTNSTLRFDIDSVGKATFGGDMSFSGGNVDIDGGDTDGRIIISSNTNSLGGNIIMYGDTHASLARNVALRSNTTNMLSLDGTTSAATFAGNISVSKSSAAVNITSTSATADAVLAMQTNGGGVGEEVKILMGDAANIDQGRILWDNDTGDLKLYSGDALTATFDNTNNATFAGVISAKAVVNGGEVMNYGGAGLTTTGVSYSSAALEHGFGVVSRTGADNTYSSTYASSLGRSVIRAGNGEIKFKVSSNQTVAIGNAITMTDALTIANNTNATFAGSISKASGSFNIPHPLPEKVETHRLVHSFVESPRAENLYSGMVTLVDGTASVNIDTHSGMTEGTFEALNTLLTHSSSNEGGYSPVKCSVVGNVITINCQDATSTDKVYWEVRGERKDQHMLDTEWTDDEGHVIVEPLKEVVEAVVEEVVENV